MSDPVPTVELLYGKPEDHADYEYMLNILNALEASYSNLVIGYDVGVDTVSVMVGDLDTFRDVIHGLHRFPLKCVSVTVHGDIAKTGDEHLGEQIHIQANATLWPNQHVATVKET